MDLKELLNSESQTGRERGQDAFRDHGAYKRAFK